LIGQLKERITWVGLEFGKKVPQPAYGQDKAFDEACEALQAQKKKMREYLQEVKDKIGDERI